MILELLNSLNTNCIKNFDLQLIFTHVVNSLYYGIINRNFKKMFNKLQNSIVLK